MPFRADGLALRRGFARQHQRHCTIDNSRGPRALRQQEAMHIGIAACDGSRHCAREMQKLGKHYQTASRRQREEPLKANLAFTPCKERLEILQQSRGIVDSRMCIAGRHSISDPKNLEVRVRIDGGNLWLT